MINYEGDTIDIEEMPNGCIISEYQKEFPQPHIIIITKRDAEAVIESLQRMIKVLEEEENAE